MTVKYTKVNEQKLLEFSTKVLEKAGIPSDDAAIAARLMVNTDLRGIASHGVAHLKGLYVKRIKTGFINSNRILRCIAALQRLRSSTATVDLDL